jgi:hypothetical protein
MWLELMLAASACLIVIVLLVSLTLLIVAVASACVLSALLAYRVVRDYQQQLSYPRELIARELVAQTAAAWSTMAIADATGAGRIPPGTEVVGSGDKLRRPPMRGHPKVRADGGGGETVGVVGRRVGFGAGRAGSGDPRGSCASDRRAERRGHADVNKALWWA